MAAVTGIKGTVTYDGGNVAGAKNWSIDIDTNMHDVTPFTTSADAWRVFAAGLSGWTGGIDAVAFDPTSTGQSDMITKTLVPAAVTVVLEMDQTAGGKFTGSAFISSASFGSDIDGLADAGWSLQGSGSLAFSTST